MRMNAVAPVLIAVLVLTGCTAAPGPAPSTGAPSASTPPTAASASPSAEPAAACDSILTAETYAKFEADGIERIEPPIVVDPFAEQLVEAGGLACTWGPTAGEGLTVVRLSGADWSVWEAELADAGFVESNDPVPGAYTGPADPAMDETPIVIVTGDTLTFANNPTVASWVVPTS